jgi:hypothetical protein
MRHVLPPNTQNLNTHPRMCACTHTYIHVVTLSPPNSNHKTTNTCMHIHTQKKRKKQGEKNLIVTILFLQITKPLHMHTRAKQGKKRWEKILIVVVLPPPNQQRPKTYNEKKIAHGKVMRMLAKDNLSLYLENEKTRRLSVKTQDIGSNFDNH